MKKDFYYYNNLCDCVSLSYEAAQFLKDQIIGYQRGTLKKKTAYMHELEQKADAKKHEMTTQLSKAFITPIEREDLMALSNYLDDITDAVEEVLLQFYICNVDQIRPDVLPLVNLLLESIHTLGDVMEELKDFKHSKKLENYIIRVNDLEEQADRLYTENLHRLYQEQDIKTIIVWQKIYEYMENCIDTCEHAADIVGTVKMKNL